LRRGGEEAGVGEGQFVSTAESEGKKRVARGPRAKGSPPRAFSVGSDKLTNFEVKPRLHVTLRTLRTPETRNHKVPTR